MLKLIQYQSIEYNASEGLSASEVSELIKKEGINWIDVEITDSALVDQITQVFHIHPLLVEDIMATEQLPKFELFEEHLFFNMKMLTMEETASEIREEHLSILMMGNVLITFQEGLPGDVFDELRNRIKLAKGVIRKYGVDFLFYHLIDAVVDRYLHIMETLRDQIELLEAQLVAENGFDVMPAVIETKRNIGILRKYTVPLRDALNKMKVEGRGFIKKSSVNYFQDVSDHLNFLMSNFELSREMLKDLMDLHNSNQNNERNRVMKTLTVVSAIFIPLTFLAGLYGMNFKYMPELESRNGYFVVLGAMLLVAISMSVYMWLKKWF